MSKIWESYWSRPVLRLFHQICIVFMYIGPRIIYTSTLLCLGLKWYLIELEIGRFEQDLNAYSYEHCAAIFSLITFPNFNLSL